MTNKDYVSLEDALALHIKSGCEFTNADISFLLKGCSSNTIYILRDMSGVSIGYVVYSNINKYSLKTLIRNGTPPRYLYEWSEGKICYVRNIFLMPNRSFEAMRSLLVFSRKSRLILYQRRSSFKLLKRKNNRTFAKLGDFRGEVKPKE